MKMSDFSELFPWQWWKDAIRWLFTGRNFGENPACDDIADECHRPIN